MKNTLNFLLLASLISTIKTFNYIPNLILYFLFNKKDFINAFMLLLIAIILAVIGGIIVKMLIERLF